jgi:hypothetical protein
MATARNPQDRSVTRTYRAALKLGDDYVTLEETVTLPVGASDEDIEEAVKLGLRIYTAQQAAIEEQIQALRDAQGAPAPITVREPEAPASEKQRNYISTLQDQLTWTSEQLTSYAHEQNVDLVTLTKGQASIFIDGLKKLAEEYIRYHEMQKPGITVAIATDRQMQALTKMAQTYNVDLAAEVRRLYGVKVEELNRDQAGAILTEWKRVTPRNAIRRSEPAI